MNQSFETPHPPLPQEGGPRRLDDGSRRIGAIATLEDGAGCPVSGAAVTPGTSPPKGRPVPLLRGARSLQASSRVVMGRAAHLRTADVKPDGTMPPRRGWAAAVHLEDTFRPEGAAATTSKGTAIVSRDLAVNACGKLTTRQAQGRR
jgi:hypothetical protein